MTIAREGDAVICGVMVRRGSVIVLRALATLKEPTTVQHLGEVIQDPHSDAELRTILNRLSRQPTLVTRTEQNVEGKQLKRVLWEATLAVKKFFVDNPLL